MGAAPYLRLEVSTSFNYSSFYLESPKDMYVTL